MRPYKRMSKSAMAILVVGAMSVTGASSYASIASAQSLTPTSDMSIMRAHSSEHGVFGTVAGITGNTMTVLVKGPKGTTTTYSVDVSAAKIQKGTPGTAPVIIPASAITIGDTVAIRGAINGTSVVATDVMSGLMKKNHKEKRDHKKRVHMEKRSADKEDHQDKAKELSHENE